ncbi:M48 family metallopeptidase [Tautonia marina]|uniref:M48 family metallopeptidase n=1 Tax=Tautonia marina TaxID=2653855 RepID=UPI0012608F7E|nr:M48 family metallopeptidase [Tautonia marina]
MPLLVLIALFVAFWSPIVPENMAGPTRPDPSLAMSLGMILASVLMLGFVSAVIGRRLARKASQVGQTFRNRHQLARSAQILEVLALLAYAGLIYVPEWPRVVADRLRLRDWLLVEEALILLPFPIMILTVWWGLFPAERSLKAARVRIGQPIRLGGHLLMKARQAFGLVLPVAVLFALMLEVDRRLESMVQVGAWVHLGLYAALGGLILILSPAFVRLSWPSRPLPPGPLRDRLEHLAQRFGFGYTDILVWDTGGTLVNAGVTGALPWFRYVLLTDAMLENLAPRQIEAVFGHEVGHIAHRHLTYFGVFFLGTMGVMALLSAGIDQVLTLDSPLWIWGRSRWVELLLQAAVALGFALAYFFVIFGFLSRWFERQADVFGCRVVSCGLADCPPHRDVNADPSMASGRVPEALCPVGIGIFIEALSSVATLNGLEPRAASWRHGSIARRIDFLRQLEGRPEVEQRFQTQLQRLRLGLGLVLATAMLLAITTGAIDSFR